MAHEIRTLTPADREDILRVWEVSGLPIKPLGRESSEMMAAEMGRDFCTYLGAFGGDRLLGVVIVQFDGRHGWINRLAVDPAGQHQGIAGALITVGIEWLTRFGEELVISALIEEDNEPSRACFARHGFHCHTGITYWSKRPREDL